jgi:chemotaxis response regulator CheB
MTRKNDTVMIRPPVIPGTGNRPIDYRGVSVLLVFSNPIISDRICRQLERNENMMIEICLSEDDAIHFLEYIRFDVILIGYTTGMTDRIRFLQALRTMYPSIPVIYYPLLRDQPPGNVPREYGPVYFVARQNSGTGDGHEDLHPVIMQAMSENEAGNCRNVLPVGDD